MTTSIRPATPADLAAIDAVHRAAFPTAAEAQLVALLIQRGRGVVSLVALDEGRRVGHILFSPATIQDGSSTSAGLGLAPLAVLPGFQNQGIGSALVRAGLAECRSLGIAWVIVLGEPAYYGRFGFAPASRWNLTGEYGGGDAFQAIPLQGQALPAGLAHYCSEFSELFPPE